MTGKDVYQKKNLLEKAVTMKRFDYSPLGKELNAQTNIAKKQYQKMYKKIVKNLITFPLKSNYLFLVEVFNNLNKFKN